MAKEKAKKPMAINVKDATFHSFSMAITKASIPDKANRTMRISLVNSDTGEDVYGERMSVELFEDFVERIEANMPVPEPFDAAVCEDGWCGGLPYLSISHFKSAEGKNVPGDVEKVYVDGEKLKSNAILHDSPLGNAVWKSICEDLYEEKSEKPPVRVSIGFLDLKHKHVIEDEKDFIFTRSNLEDGCPLCAEGIEGKIYLKGQLVHKAFTRVPANPRTDVEVFRMAEESAIKTKKGDAKSIVGDLAEELVVKSQVDDEILVIRTEKDLEDYAHGVRMAFYSEFDPPPDPTPYVWVRSVTEKNVIISEDGVLYKVSYKETNGEFSFDERSKWTQVTIGFVPVKSKATDEDWQIMFEEEVPEKSKSSEEAMKTKTEQEEVPVEPVVEKVEKPVDEPKSTVEEAVAVFLSKVEEVKGKPEAITELQPLLNSLVKATESEVAGPLDGLADIVKSAVQEAVEGLKPGLVAEVLKAMPATQAVVSTNDVPKARSLLIDKSAPSNKELSQIEKLARQSTIGQ